MHNDSLHETQIHGQLSFPYIVYKGNIPAFFSSYPLHWHDEMEVIYIRSGQGIITVQSHQYIVKSDDIVIIPPQMVHSIEQYQKAQMEYYNILFHFSLLHYSANDTCYEKYFKPLYCHTKLPSPYLESEVDLNRFLRPHIMYLIENRKKSYTSDELMVKSNLFAIMHYITQYSSPPSSAELSLKNNYDKLKNLLLHIQSNYDHAITVKDAAAICGFSSSHFMKLFKELTGKSFSQYLIDYRLEIAARQLVETSYKIIDLAENVGFHNVSYFSRAFHSKYGETPSAYRKSTRPKADAP
ncbi:MAG: AraC family transcriptional regulator [Lachnospiraceae bacterium]|nr:AraC family transcriptional regulator [Lachnospiraceae bacterium]